MPFVVLECPITQKIYRAECVSRGEHPPSGNKFEDYSAECGCKYHFTKCCTLMTAPGGEEELLGIRRPVGHAFRIVDEEDPSDPALNLVEVTTHACTDRSYIVNFPTPALRRWCCDSGRWSRPLEPGDMVYD